MCIRDSTAGAQAIDQVEQGDLTSGVERFDMIDGVAVVLRLDGGQIGIAARVAVRALAGLQQMRLAGTRFAPEQEQCCLLYTSRCGEETAVEPAALETAPPQAHRFEPGVDADDLPFAK